MMNNLITNKPSMTSLEIAELVEKTPRQRETHD